MREIIFSSPYVFATGVDGRRHSDLIVDSDVGQKSNAEVAILSVNYLK